MVSHHLASRRQGGAGDARTTPTINSRIRTSPRQNVRMSVCPRQQYCEWAVLHTKRDRWKPRPVNPEQSRRGAGRSGKTCVPSASDSASTEADGEDRREPVRSTLNGQQLALLKTSGLQPFMDEVNQLTDAFLNTCEALGRQTLPVSRETGCDQMTPEGSSGAARVLEENCPTVCWHRVFCSLWSPW